MSASSSRTQPAPSARRRTLASRASFSTSPGSELERGGGAIHGRRLEDERVHAEAVERAPDGPPVPPPAARGVRRNCWSSPRKKAPESAAYPARVTAPAIRGFTHISLSVRDLDSSLHFYRDVLGLPILAAPYDGEVFEGREAMLLAGRTALCLQCHTANTGAKFDPRQSGLDHIALAVASFEELEAFAQHLTAEGIDHSGVKALPGFGDFIELRDPDGVLVELHALPT